MGKEQAGLDESSMRKTDILERCRKYEEREKRRPSHLSDEESLDRTAPLPENNQRQQEVIDFDEPAAGNGAVSDEENKE